MRDLSLHIIDIVQNSVRADASLVNLTIEISGEVLIIRIGDNGCGMTAETLQKVTDPFYTTRTTRKVGLGLPFFKQSAEQSGGELIIESEVGVGTVVTATLGLHHLDRPPMGDLSETVSLVMSGNPQVDIVFTCKDDKNEFTLVTTEVKEILGDLDISMPKVTRFLREMIEENLIELKLKIE